MPVLAPPVTPLQPLSESSFQLYRSKYATRRSRPWRKVQQAYSWRYVSCSHSQGDRLTYHRREEIQQEPHPTRQRREPCEHVACKYSLPSNLSVFIAFSALRRIEATWLIQKLKDPVEEDEDESEDEDEESEEESSEDEGPVQPAQEMSREQRRAAAKAKKEALLAKKNQKTAAPGDLPSDDDSEEEEDDDANDMPANPNHTAASRSQASAAPSASADASASTSKKTSTSQLSRREREALQAQQARERYQKLHAEGKTDEAKADLARLKLVREKREMEAARKKAEKEEKEAAEKRRLEEMDEKERKRRDAALGAAEGVKKGRKKV